MEGGRGRRGPSLRENSPSIAHVHQQGVGAPGPGSLCPGLTLGSPDPLPFSSEQVARVRLCQADAQTWTCVTFLCVFVCFPAPRYSREACGLCFRVLLHQLASPPVVGSVGKLASPERHVADAPEADVVRGACPMQLF